MSVKAKFKVDKITPSTTTDGTVESKYIQMSAVVAYDAQGNRHDENEMWSKMTPSGNLGINITNPAAFDQFEEGKEYYLTFEATAEATTEDSVGGSNPPGSGQPGQP